MSKLDLFHSEIVEDYLINKLSMRSLVKKYGIHGKYIKAHFNKHSIPIKKHGAIPTHIQEKLDNAKWLAQAYSSTRSSQKMAEALGVTKQCVLKYMKRHGIEPKGNKFYYGGESQEISISTPSHIESNDYKSDKGYDFRNGPTNSKLKNREWLILTYKEVMNSQVIAELLDVNRQTVLNALHYHNIPIVKCGNTSNNETLLLNLLHDLNPIQSHKLDGIELDLYFPNYNLAVEIHGLRFHSELSGGKSRQYHQNKFEVCRKHGIHLYQFWDSEVSLKTDLICNMIRGKCNDTTKLHARKCDIEHGLNVKEFLDHNHLQGATNYTQSISLRLDGETISTMTFIKPRNKQYDWELNRFCVKVGYSVRGAFSRLLKHGPSGVIVSYSDCRYSAGDVYKVNGFDHIRTNDPIYYYTKNYKSLESRMAYQKSKIKAKFPDEYDSTQTEWQNMKHLGYDRVWACKTYTWVKTI